VRPPLHLCCSPRGPRQIRLAGLTRKYLSMSAGQAYAAASVSRPLAERALRTATTLHPPAPGRPRYLGEQVLHRRQAPGRDQLLDPAQHPPRARGRYTGPSPLVRRYGVPLARSFTRRRI
jgi:hypothetical protein